MFIAMAASDSILSVHGINRKSGSVIWEAGRLTSACHLGSSKAFKGKNFSVSVLSLCLEGGYLLFLNTFSPFDKEASHARSRPI